MLAMFKIPSFCFSYLFNYNILKSSVAAVLSSFDHIKLFHWSALVCWHPFEDIKICSKGFSWTEYLSTPPAPWQPNPFDKHHHRSINIIHPVRGSFPTPFHQCPFEGYYYYLINPLFERVPLPQELLLLFIVVITWVCTACTMTDGFGSEPPGPLAIRQIPDAPPAKPEEERNDHRKGKPCEQHTMCPRIRESIFNIK